MEGSCELDKILRMEKCLKKRAKILKTELEEVNGKIVKKQNEVDLLLVKINVLRLGKQKPKECDENNVTNIREITDFKSNQEQERLAESLLLEEVWLEIFSKIHDGLDLLNASRTCQHFQNILHPSKPTFLFQNVFYHLLPYFGFKTVLKCRQICKDWRAVINSFLEDRTHIQTFETANSSPPTFIEMLRAYDFNHSDNKLTNFFQKIITSSSPFISKSVWINTDAKLDSEFNQKDFDFYDGIDKLMKKFGKYIHHFKLTLWGRREIWADPNAFLHPNQLNLHLFFDKLFQNIPNLRSLSLRQVHLLDFSFEINVEDIPSIPNLETLSISGEVKQPLINPIFNSFHSQIKRLYLYGPQDILYLASHFNWPQVDTLSFEFPKFQMDWKPSTDIGRCLNSFKNLKKLCLTCCTNTSFEAILKVVKNLPQTCPYFHTLSLKLVIQFGASKYRFSKQLSESNLFAPIQLDSLQLEMVYFDLENMDNFDFSFLARFPFIKMLNLSCYPIFKKPEGFRRKYKDIIKNGVEIVEVHKCFVSNPYSSNIWRILPNLQTLQIQNKIYKRKTKPLAKNSDKL